MQKFLQKNEFQNQIGGQKLHLAGQNLAKSPAVRMDMPNFVTSTQKLVKKSWKNIREFFFMPRHKSLLNPIFSGKQTNYQNQNFFLFLKH